jgi:hypothetical protein
MPKRASARVQHPSILSSISNPTSHFHSPSSLRGLVQNSDKGRDDVVGEGPHTSSMSTAATPLRFRAIRVDSRRNI